MPRVLPIMPCSDCHIAQALEALIAAGAVTKEQLVQLLTNTCGTVLGNVAKGKAGSLVQTLLKAVPWPEQLVLLVKEGGEDTALIAAVRQGHVAAAEALLAYAPEAQVAAVTRGSRNTPLHIAAASNSAALVQILLRHSPRQQVLQRNWQGNTPLQQAVMQAQCSREVVQLLLQHMPEEQVSMENENRELPLMWAVCHHNLSVTRLLLAHLPLSQVLHRDWQRQTALAKAVMCGRADAARLLLAHCPERQVWHAFENGHNALSLAVLGGCIEAVRLLLQHSPQQQVAHRLEGGVTLLGLAAARGDAEMLELLLPYTRNTKALDAALETAAIAAPLAEGHRRCCQLLFMHGGSVASLSSGYREAVEAVLRDTMQRHQASDSIDQAIVEAVVRLAYARI